MNYRYFSDEEVDGLVPELCECLDLARGYAGFPFHITSGKRTPEENAATGGVPDSSHLRGEAADLSAPSDPFLREKMCWALGRAGFRRVFMYTKHVHVDVDERKYQDIMMYLGESK